MDHRHIVRALAAAFWMAIVVSLCAPAGHWAAAAGPAADDCHLVRCRHGAVVCVSRAASQIGLSTLKQGGNSVDAAVATALALAVSYPGAGNIGGGGYMLVVPARESETAKVYDFREVAPAAATREMFVDGPATPHRRVGVPGTVRGLALAHSQWGRLPWRDLVMPAAKLARAGVELDRAVAEQLNAVLARSDRSLFANLHRTYGRADGRPWAAGDLLMLPELAGVLERVAEQGPDGFYTGQVARWIAEEMRSGGGLVTAEDLATYRPIVREPIAGTYRDCQLLAVPPSSSGGATLLEALQILEAFDLRARGRWSAETLHLLIESARRAYRDRACYLGDPAGTQIPDKLLSKDYARQLAASIDRQRATPSEELAGEIPLAAESPETTHLSVVDSQRNAVSLTYTLESSFGSRVVVGGGGFLLNDEMNDFNWRPGVTDRSGRIGTPPNEIAPGKRMLSSMCPIVLRRNGQTLLVTGSPGGRTIINTVLQLVVNIVDFDMDPRQAVDAPRLHHGWFPDRVRAEGALAAEHAGAVETLRRMGHQIVEARERQGDAHSIWIDPATGEIVAAADRRTSGNVSGF